MVCHGNRTAPCVCVRVRVRVRVCVRMCVHARVRAQVCVRAPAGTISTSVSCPYCSNTLAISFITPYRSGSYNILALFQLTFSA